MKTKLKLIHTIIECPICKKVTLSFDSKTLTISCNGCHNYWIHSKRIRRNKAGKIDLVKEIKE